MSISALTGSWATYALGSFWVLNNVWGAGNLVNGKDYSQSITVNSDTFPNGVTMSWRWPRGKSVLSYPEIVYGTQQSMPAPAGLNMPRPTQVANFANLSAEYSISISGQKRNFDVGFNLWLRSRPNGGPETIEDELMIFVHNPWGSAKGAKKIGTVDSADIYVNYDWGNEVQHWAFIQLVPTASQLSGTVEFSYILKTLIWKGILTGDEYISGIELGAEVGSGSGSLTINSLSYRWDASPTVKRSASNEALTISAMGGNHVIGNRMLKVVSYKGAYSEYQIKQSGSKLLVVRGNNISTLDVLDGVSDIKFSNGIYYAATAKFMPTMLEPR